MPRSSTKSGAAVPGFDFYWDDATRDRFRVMLERIGSLVRAGEIAGVSDEQVARWRDGKAKPNFGGVAAIAMNAGMSLDWLTGNEPSGGTADLTMIERLDVEASAGNGALIDNEQALDFVAFQTRWLRRKGINPAAVRLLNIRGDSMEPTIRDGDIALVDTSIDDIIDNAIYVLVVGNRLLIKRIHILMSGALRLISDNALYPHEDVPASEAEFVRVSGRVVWFGRSI